MIIAVLDLAKRRLNDRLESALLPLTDVNPLSLRGGAGKELAADGREIVAELLSRLAYPSPTIRRVP